MLPGLELRRLDNLFFALRPQREIVPALDAAAAGAALRHGLYGKPLGETRYHVSLQSVMALEGVPDSTVGRIDQAARMIDLPAFEIRFDRIMSFGGRYGKHALVLAGCMSPDAQALYRQLGLAMRAVGLRSGSGRFVPHVTLLYDRKRIDMEAVEPISWRVTGFVLIDSLQGRSIHEEKGCWPLRELISAASPAGKRRRREPTGGA